MGGGGGKKGGGGNTNPSGTVTPPPGMMTSAEQLGNIGAYESQFLNQPYSLGNWAMNYATGGTGPQASQPPGFAGPGTNYFGPNINGPGGNQEPWLNLNSYGGGGSGGGAGTPPNPFGVGGIPGGRNSGGGNWMAETGPGGFPNLLNEYGSSLGTEQQILGSAAPGTRYKDIAAMESQFQNDITGNKINTNPILNFGPDWLTPAQESMINTQTQANQAALEQQMGSQGLTGSTMEKELAGEEALQGTATKGSLEQQNMALALQQQQQLTAEQQTQEGIVQNWQKMMMGEQEFGLQDQQQFFNLAQAIGSSAAGEQSALWQEGTSGYQLMNTFMNAVTAPYGLQIQDFGDILSAEAQTGSASISANAQEAAAGAGTTGQIISSVAQIAVAFA